MAINCAGLPCAENMFECLIRYTVYCMVCLVIMARTGTEVVSRGLRQVSGRRSVNLKRHLLTHHPPKLTFPLQEGIGGSSTTMEKSRSLCTGWDLNYLYRGNPKSRWQTGVKGLLKTCIKRNFTQHWEVNSQPIDSNSILLLTELP